MLRKFEHLTLDEFPELLQEIPDAPKELWLEGKLPSSELKCLAVVGSRKYSGYGREACEFLLHGLAGQPIVIVSGLAIGIDTIAHKTALAAGLITIAIPGSGLDRAVLHPPSNVRLADEIIEAGGALISELPPTAPAGLHTFPRRNRIMAGLAHAVLIIEASEQSGTLITANTLLSQGAAPARGSGDILATLGIRTDDNEPRTLNLDLFTPIERSIIELLADEPSPRDGLIRALKLPVSEANTIIASLELRGAIVERLGEFYLA
ncbi:MAG: protecting protein DprA protein [Parcubacteria group bacterium GW2011_GWF1_52_5]|nr:MAG: protecting protein DprA protein [Parcubacteria group bacterium GW2011_GWF1_52_5]